MPQDAKIIALTGKGGVGKTTLSAAIVRLLSENFPGKKILAIDADPAVGLATALGVEVIKTLDDIRLSVADDVMDKLKDTEDILAEARFQMFEAMQERPEGFCFVAIGRPEAAGCYCAINTYLRNVISAIAGDFDFVVIDGEAGVEQINRRVMEKVSHLILVSDQSRKGIQVINTIKDVSNKLVMADRMGVVFNRIYSPDLIDGSEVPGAPLLAVIPPDENHAANDIKGASVFTLPADSNVLKGAEKVLKTLEIL